MFSTAASTTESSTRVRAVLDSAKAPVALKALAKQTKLSPVELRAVLAAELDRRSIYRWPDARKDQRFWNRSAEATLEQHILGITTQCAIPLAALSKEVRKRMPPYPAKLIASAIQQLIRDKQLVKYRAFNGSSQIIGRAGRIEAYEAAARNAIEAIRAQVAALGGAIESPAVPPDTDLETAILESMALLEPSHTAPVSVRELRAALPHAAKGAFDQAALRLRNRRRVFLSRHDFPQSLSLEDRSALIEGPDGSYYVAIAARHE